MNDNYEISNIQNQQKFSIEIEFQNFNILRDFTLTQQIQQLIANFERVILKFNEIKIVNLIVEIKKIKITNHFEHKAFVEILSYDSNVVATTFTIVVKFKFFKFEKMRFYKGQNVKEHFR